MADYWGSSTVLYPDASVPGPDATVRSQIGWTQATQDGGATDPSFPDSDPCAQLGFIGGLNQPCYDQSIANGWDQKTALGLCCMGVTAYKPTPGVCPGGIPCTTIPDVGQVIDGAGNVIDKVTKSVGTGLGNIARPLNSTLILVGAVGLVAIVLLSKAKTL